MDAKLPSRSLPFKIINMIMEILYHTEVLPAIDKDGFRHHRCVLDYPCIPLRPAVALLRNLRGVCKSWKVCYERFLPSHFYCDRKITDIPYFLGSSESQIERLMRRKPDDGFVIAYDDLQDDDDTSVLACWDYRGDEGCKTAKNIVYKISKESWTKSQFEVERLKYEALQRKPMIGIPEFLGSKQYGEYDVLVLEKLGPCFQTIFKAGVVFTERMAMALAIQLVLRLKDLHGRKIIHNGMKHGNVTICPLSITKIDPKRTHIYLIDFGVSSMIEHTVPTDLEGCVYGNCYFLSALSQHDIMQSPRDDLESAAYLVAFMYRGLPWYKGYSAPKDNINPDKFRLTGKALFGDLDQSFVEWFRDIRLLAWGEKPKYDKMIDRFCKAWRRKGFMGEPGEVDWLEIWEDTLERKACYMQEADLYMDDDQVGAYSIPTSLDDPTLTYALTTAFDYCASEETFETLHGGNSSSESLKSAEASSDLLSSVDDQTGNLTEAMRAPLVPVRCDFCHSMYAAEVPLPPSPVLGIPSLCSASFEDDSDVEAAIVTPPDSPFADGFNLSTKMVPNELSPEVQSEGVQSGFMI